MKSIFFILFLIGIQIPTFADDTKKSDITINGKIHTFDEIFILLEKSDISYELVPLDSTTNIEIPEKRLMSNLMFIDESDDKRILYYYSVSDSAAMLFTIGDAAYLAKDYESSILAYRQVLEIDPSLNYAYTLVADGFYMLNMLDSAIYYYNIALDSNYYNY